ncbi:MAG TPA: hypothetical protein DCL29_00250 [Eubacterium sp.]|nr:hypothetical protein [Eubacterium sp.]
MKTQTINKKQIINAYNNGQSLNAIAKEFHTYATSIKRILEKENVELRHDSKRAGQLYVKDGEKLIEWAKAQKRLVTKTELAHVIGRKKLSPSYFEKYPELGRYVTTREQSELQIYSQKLYDWLQKTGIQYKPNDRTKINMSVTALLLGEYEGLALQIHIKPKCISKKQYEERVKAKVRKASKSGIFIIWLNKDHFENLDSTIGLLNAFKK